MSWCGFVAATATAHLEVRLVAKPPVDPIKVGTLFLDPAVAAPLFFSLFLGIAKTAALAAVVSLGMALLIHGMSAVILRFSAVPTTASAAPPAEEAGADTTPSSRPTWRSRWRSPPLRRTQRPRRRAGVIGLADQRLLGEGRARDPSSGACSHNCSLAAAVPERSALSCRVKTR